MAIKLAVSGKGGVGKSTLSAALSQLLAEDGKKVLAVDADPDANLASSLGFPAEVREKIVPVSQQVALIEERTGAKVNQYGQIFQLNPKVSDIADNYATSHNGVALLVLGAVEQGGGGCGCPENVLLRALVTDLILYKDDALVMDMEAGVEHLGRATATGVDCMLVVVEPGQRSIDCAERVIRMAKEIGLEKIAFVLNKVTSKEDEEFILKHLQGQKILGVIPYSEEIRQADMKGCSVIEDLSEEIVCKYREVLEKVLYLK
ncbi:MAG: ATP-binding protein [Planctomycetota bacterium]|jgi:CO dehydrogenase maturation factor